MPRACVRGRRPGRAGPRGERLAPWRGVRARAGCGLPGVVVASWGGSFVPAGTPRPIVTKLQHDIVAVLRSKEVRDLFSAQATDVVGNTPEEFAQFVKGESQRWSRVVRTSGAKPD